MTSEINNVMIVEDHRFVADATVNLLRDLPGVGEITTYGTADEAKSALAAQPGCWGLILLDLDVPGAVGLSLAKHIRQLGLAPITCILTGTYSESYIAQARAEGFLGYILKASAADELEQSLRQVLGGQRIFPALGHESIVKSSILLTLRQRDVLELVASGMTSKEVARQLQLTLGTVNNHIAASMTALGARNRLEAVTKALELALIQAKS
jgi:DNA-binding NarL/FixJ family response regulator